jgi:hypothetical protein
LAIQAQKVTRLIWRLLASALGDDLLAVQQEVASGRAVLTRWNNEFFVVLRDEKTDLGKELVIVAAAGKNSLKHLVDISQQAKAQNYQSIRLHTLKPEPMLRMSKSAGLGFERAETILRRVF